MLQHADGDKEYYNPQLSGEDMQAIFNILDKYGDDNESLRGNLKITEDEPHKIIIQTLSDSDNMLKYNYTGAAALWDEYYNIVCDPWTLASDEKQKERRCFMRSITRGDCKQYINYIDEMIEEARPIQDAKSRCYDFEYEKELEKIKHKIFTFSHCIERYA